MLEDLVQIGTGILHLQLQISRGYRCAFGVHACHSRDFDVIRDPHGMRVACSVSTAGRNW